MTTAFSERRAVVIQAGFYLFRDRPRVSPVKSGLSSDTHVEVVKGLESGEVVVEGPYRTLARDLVDGMRATTESVEK